MAIINADPKPSEFDVGHMPIDPRGLARSIMAVPLPSEIVTAVKRREPTQRRRGSDPLGQNRTHARKQSDGVTRPFIFLLGGVLHENHLRRPLVAAHLL